MRELLLGEVVADENAVLDRATEAAREFEKCLGDSAGNVSEDEVGEVLVGAAQAAGERGEQRERDLRVGREVAVEGLRPEADELSLRDRGGGCGAGAGIKEAQLTEHLTRPQNGKEVLAAIQAGAAKFDLALGDHIETVALVALVEQDVAALHTNRRHRGQQISCRRFIQTGEKGGSAQHVVIHVGSVPEHP